MLLTAAEVAELVGVSVATVRRRTREGRLRCVKTPFGVRYRPEDVFGDACVETPTERDRIRQAVAEAKDALDALLEVL